jgi:hypothetical protein
MIDHQELYNNLSLVLDTAKEEIQQRDRRRNTMGIVERVIMFAQNAAGHSLENYFTGLIFDLAVANSNEDLLDDFWLGVLLKLLLLLENSRTDTSVIRVKRLANHFDSITAGR